MLHNCFLMFDHVNAFTNMNMFWQYWNNTKIEKRDGELAKKKEWDAFLYMELHTSHFGLFRSQQDSVRVEQISLTLAVPCLRVQNGEWEWMREQREQKRILLPGSD